MTKLMAFFTLVLILSVGVLLPPFLNADASNVPLPDNHVNEGVPVPSKDTTPPNDEYKQSRGYQLVKAKIGHDLAKLAYDEVLKHQKEGVNIDLTMWYTLVNYRENPRWNFKAKNYNSNGTWDCGLGQVNMKACIEEAFQPRWAIKKSISILASKSKMVGGAKWHTFKRYNGGGAKAEAYATICWDNYTKLKGA